VEPVLHGRAVQVVDPIKPALKAPGTKRLELIYDGPLSNFAFKFNLRRYTTELFPVDGETCWFAAEQFMTGHTAGGVLRTSTRPTVNIEPGPRFCISL